LGHGMIDARPARQSCLVPFFEILSLPGTSPVSLLRVIAFLLLGNASPTSGLSWRVKAGKIHPATWTAHIAIPGGVQQL
jgi:hypothetical protein